MRIRLILLLILVLRLNPGAASEPFALRGYYLTFMRMPVMGLPEWKEAIDCFAEDNVNVVTLWTAGGFRSKKFPVTWAHNEDHANVRQDFVRDLIDYAHTQNLRVLLGFTPFGYDGVNRFPYEHPDLKARKRDGTPVDPFGIGCWGWNLCPAQPESQRLLREYAREMVFDFYPNADGLLVESSDYAICQCPDCGPRHYEREYAFVREFSDEVWQRNPNALVLVYPHYFTGQKVPGLEATAAKQPFDPRWGLFFTPHSAHFDADLIRQARTSVFWSDAPVLGTPRRVMEAARSARAHGVTGFVPSLESYSYLPRYADGGEPWVIGRRMRPFGLDPLGEGRMPYRALLVRVQRFAFREFSQNPVLDYAEFERRLGEHISGAGASGQNVSDLLELQRIWTHESDWYWASPLLEPDFFRQRAKRLQWPAEKLADYDRNLDRLKELAARYAASSGAAGRELGRLAQTIVQRWGADRPGLSGTKTTPSGQSPTSMTFTNPIVARGADPWVVRWGGSYYFCQSDSGRRVWVSRSDRLQDIGRGDRQTVWTPPVGTPYSKELWAPELHHLRGQWWIYVAADDGDNANHRMYVLEGTSQDPQAPFTFKGKIAAPAGRWAIDATVLQMPGDKLYLIWSGWEGVENVAQHLYIAPMSNPWTVSGERVRITSPELDWEKHGKPLINEGPEVLWHGDRLFLIYSASGSWGDDYCLGQLTWTGGDVLDPRSWVKKSVPVFSRTPDVFGPGHCSFVKSPDGKEDWIIYHSAKHAGAGWNRRVNLQRFHWSADGSPDFGVPDSAGVPVPAPSNDPAK